MFGGGIVRRICLLKCSKKGGTSIDHEVQNVPYHPVGQLQSLSATAWSLLQVSGQNSSQPANTETHQIFYKTQPADFFPPLYKRHAQLYKIKTWKKVQKGHNCTTQRHTLFALFSLQRFFFFSLFRGFEILFYA